MLTVAPGDRPQCTLEYRPDCLTAEDADRIGERLLGILAGFAAEPTRPVGLLDVRTAAERSSLATAAETEDPALSTVAAVFEEQAARTPDAPALTAGTERLTFAALNTRANRLAHQLIARGIGPEDRVGILLPRTADLLVSVLAVLKAGAAYVPIDPDHPDDRIQWLLADSAPKAVLTCAELAADLPPLDVPLLHVADLAGEELAGVEHDPTDADRLAPLSPDHPAYLIYTSGSTGRPKGVVVPHRGVAHLIATHRAGLMEPAVARLGRMLRVAHVASFVFDGSWTPLVWLFGGHELHLLDDTAYRDAPVVVGYLDAHRVDVLDVTPTYLAELCEHGLARAWPAPPGRAAGRRRGDLRRAVAPGLRAARHRRLRPVRADRDHSGRLRLGGRRGRRAARPPAAACPVRRARRRAAPGARRRPRRAVPVRSGAGPWLPRPPGADRVPVRRRPVRPARLAGSTAPVTWCAAGPTACWSSPAGPMTR